MLTVKMSVLQPPTTASVLALECTVPPGTLCYRLLHFFIFTDLWHLWRMPKDIKPEIPVEDSGKGKGSPKVTKPRVS
jgi:hypothetical protein